MMNKHITCQVASRISFGSLLALMMFFLPLSVYGTNTCNNKLVHWDLDACYPGELYSELDADTFTPDGFHSVHASEFSNMGAHSCVWGQSGKGICHEIRNSCDWVDNSEDAYRFSVTVTPQSGKTVKLSKLTFFEKAPLTYEWTNGQTGDNDPPSKYGIRVLVNGHEIYQKTGISTTQDWTLESITFSGDPDFTVSSQTTFHFELLGYCRSNGTSGVNAWDVDEVKLFGCEEDPCDGVDVTGIKILPSTSVADGAQLCDADVPDHANLEALVAGNPGSVKIKIWRNGTQIYSDIENAVPYEAYAIDWTQGHYQVQVKAYSGSNLTGTICDDRTFSFDIGDCSDPCADIQINGIKFVKSDGSFIHFQSGDEFCDSELPAQAGILTHVAGPVGSVRYIIKRNGTEFYNDLEEDAPYEAYDIDLTPASYTVIIKAYASDDGTGEVCDHKTVTFKVEEDPDVHVASTDPDCGENNGKITFTFPDNPDRTNIEFSLDGGQTYPLNVADDSGMAMFSDLAAGSYEVYVRWGNDECENDLGTVTLTAPADADNDGVCDDEDCAPNDPFFPNTPGTPCDDGDPNTTNDMVTADGCDCQGTSADPCDGVDIGTIKFVNDNGSFTPFSDGDKFCDSELPAQAGLLVHVAGPVGSVRYIIKRNGTEFYNDLEEDAPYEAYNIDLTPGHYAVIVKAYASDDGSGDVCDHKTFNFDVLEDPEAHVSTTDPDCNEDNGKITFTFPDNPNRTGIEFSIDGGQTFPLNVPDNSGMAMFSDLAAGNYDVAVRWGNDECEIDLGSVTLTAPSDMDSDGVCDDEDCAPNNSFFPNTPGTACDDGNPNTENDMVTADGCDCEGTPVGPCDDAGGDSDDDGVCDDDDCAPNDPFFPNTPGTACDDGDPNTENDMVTADGCGCEGMPVDPCADAGGDSDDDGVCDDDDCAPNDPFFPNTPGTACDDGDPNTVNDMVTADGCGCEGTPVDDCADSTLEVDAGPNEELCEGAQATLTATVSGEADCGGGSGTTYYATNAVGGIAPNNAVGQPEACGATATSSNSATMTSVQNLMTLDLGQTVPAGTKITLSLAKKNFNPNYTVSDGVNSQDFTSTDNNVLKCFDFITGTATSSITISRNSGGLWVDGLSYTLGGGGNSDVSYLWSTGETTMSIVVNAPGNYTVMVTDCEGCTAMDDVTVEDADMDDDGVCDDDDCAPNDPFFPNTPGTACNDGDPNTVNDMVTADGCGCEGTPVGPCDDAGGDSDDDGICDDDDCAPNDPFFPNTPGTACDDGDPNTENDMVTADGCGCEGTPVDPCADAGGDSDDDGVCDDDDCAPNDPFFPNTPGTPCDDGDPSTTNDMVTADGCGCEGTPTDDCADSTLEVDAGPNEELCEGGTVMLTAVVSGEANCGGGSGTTFYATSATGGIAPSNATGQPEACGATASSSNSATMTSVQNLMTLGLGQTVPAGTTITLSLAKKNFNPNYTISDGVNNAVFTSTDNNVLKCFDFVTGTATSSITISRNSGGLWVDGLSYTLGGGGSSDVSYLWSTGETTMSIVVNAPGNYTVMVTDCEGCTAMDGVTVEDADMDDDGVCDDDDCAPNDPFFPNTPGTACDDGDPNTNNDMVTADGCGCEGTPAGACDDAGGDSDDDGVCDDDDCAPNDPFFPNTPGTPCDDGDPNTTNDMVTADGCGCEGTAGDPCDDVVVNANAGPDQSICEGTSTVLTASGGGTYLWSTGETTASITVTPTETTDYSVTVTVNGCEDVDVVNVRLEDRPSATAAGTNPTCDNSDGSITISFPNNFFRGMIQFSLDGGNTYLPNVPDNSGSVTYDGLAAGTYSVWSRWGDRDCPTEIGSVTLVNPCNGSFVTGGPSGVESQLNNREEVNLAGTGSIKLYPNPTTTEIFFEYDGTIEKALTLQVLNNLGQLMGTYQYDQDMDAKVRLDLSTYHSGVYYARFVVDGQHEMVKRFVVRK